MNVKDNFRGHDICRMACKGQVSRFTFEDGKTMAGVKVIGMGGGKFVSMKPEKLNSYPQDVEFDCYVVLKAHFISAKPNIACDVLDVIVDETAFAPAAPTAGTKDPFKS